MGRAINVIDIENCHTISTNPDTMNNTLFSDFIFLDSIFPVFFLLKILLYNISNILQSVAFPSYGSKLYNLCPYLFMST